MEVFPLLMEQGDQGSLHADLRRCMRGADNHLDAFQALIDGLSRFGRKHATATDGRVATTAIEVAQNGARSCGSNNVPNDPQPATFGLECFGRVTPPGCVFANKDSVASSYSTFHMQ